MAEMFEFGTSFNDSGIRKMIEEFKQLPAVLKGVERAVAETKIADVGAFQGQGKKIAEAFREALVTNLQSGAPVDASKILGKLDLRASVQEIETFKKAWQDVQAALQSRAPGGPVQGLSESLRSAQQGLTQVENQLRAVQKLQDAIARGSGAGGSLNARGQMTAQMQRQAQEAGFSTTSLSGQRGTGNAAALSREVQAFRQELEGQQRRLQALQSLRGAQFTPPSTSVPMERVERAGADLERGAKTAEKALDRLVLAINRTAEQITRNRDLAQDRRGAIAYGREVGSNPDLSAVMENARLDAMVRERAAQMVREARQNRFGSASEEEMVRQLARETPSGRRLAKEREAAEEAARRQAAEDAASAQLVRAQNAHARAEQLAADRAEAAARQPVDRLRRQAEESRIASQDEQLSLNARRMAVRDAATPARLAATDRLTSERAEREAREARQRRMEADAAADAARRRQFEESGEFRRQRGAGQQSLVPGGGVGSGDPAARVAAQRSAEAARIAAGQAEAAAQEARLRSQERLTSARDLRDLGGNAFSALNRDAPRVTRGVIDYSEFDRQAAELKAVRAKELAAAQALAREEEIAAATLARRNGLRAGSSYDRDDLSPAERARRGRLAEQQTVARTPQQQVNAAHEEALRMVAARQAPSVDLRSRAEQVQQRREDRQLFEQLNRSQSPAGRFVESFRRGYRGNEDRPVAEQFGQTARFSVQYGLAYSALSQFQQGLMAVVQDFAAVDAATADLAIATGQSGAALHEMSTSFADAATSVGLSGAQGVQAGARAVGYYGLSEADAATQKAIGDESVLTAGRITFLAGLKDMTKVQQDLVATQSSFNLQSPQEIEDSLAVLSRRTGRPAAELLSATSTIGTLGSNAGFDAQTIMAMVGRIASNTGQTSDAAASSLLQVLSQADNPRLLSALKGIGVETQGTTWAEQIEQLSKMNLSTMQQNQLVQVVGKGKSSQALGVLLREQGQIQSDAEAGRNAETGSGEKQWEQQTKSITFQIRAFGAELLGLGTKLAESGILAPLGALVLALRTITQAATALVNTFNSIPPPIRNIGFGLLELLVAVNLLTRVFAGGQLMKGLTGVASLINRIPSIPAATRDFFRGASPGPPGMRLVTGGPPGAIPTYRPMNPLVGGAYNVRDAFMRAGVSLREEPGQLRRAASAFFNLTPRDMRIAGPAVPPAPVTPRQAYLNMTANRATINSNILTRAANPFGQTVFGSQRLAEAMNRLRMGSAAYEAAQSRAALASNAAAAANARAAAASTGAAVADVQETAASRLVAMSQTGQAIVTAELAAAMGILLAPITLLAIAIGATALLFYGLNQNMKAQRADAAAGAKAAKAGTTANSAEEVKAAAAGQQNVIKQSLETQDVGWDDWTSAGLAPLLAKTGGSLTSQTQDLARREKMRLEANADRLAKIDESRRRNDPTDYLSFDSSESITKSLESMTGAGFSAAQQLDALTRGFEEMTFRADRANGVLFLDENDRKEMNTLMSSSATSTFAQWEADQRVALEEESPGFFTSMGPNYKDIEKRVGLLDEMNTKGIEAQFIKAYGENLKGLGTKGADGTLVLTQEEKKEYNKRNQKSAEDILKANGITAETFGEEEYKNLLADVKINANKAIEKFGNISNSPVAVQSYLAGLGILAEQDANHERIAAGGSDLAGAQAAVDAWNKGMPKTDESVKQARKAVEDAQAAYDKDSSETNKETLETANKNLENILGYQAQAKDLQMEAEQNLAQAKMQNVALKSALAASTLGTDDVSGRNAEQMNSLRQQLALATSQEDKDRINTQINDLTKKTAQDALAQNAAVAMSKINPRNAMGRTEQELKNAEAKLATLTEGSAEYAQTVDQINELKNRLADLGIEIADMTGQLGVGARDQGGQLNVQLSTAQAQLEQAVAAGDVAGALKAQLQIREIRTKMAEYQLSVASAARTLAVNPRNQGGVLQAQLADAREKLTFALSTGDALGALQAQAAIRDIQDKMAKYAMDVASAARKLAVDPRDTMGGIRADLATARAELTYALQGGDALGALQAQQQIKELQERARQEAVATQVAQVKAAVAPGDSVGSAAADVRAAALQLNAQLRGTKEWYEAQAQLRQAQKQYTEAVQAYQANLRLLNIDMTDPVAMALADLQTARAKLAASQSPSERAANLVDVRKAEASAEQAAFSQRIGDIQTADQLGRISHETYLQYLQNEHNRLVGISNRTRQQQEQLDQVDQLMKAAADQLTGQFNLGDIKLPTVYEVRRSLGAQFAGMKSEMTSVRQTSITINGADTTKVVQYITDAMGGPTGMANATLRRI